MRLTENRLRDIIRNIILREGAVTPEQLGDDFKIIIHDSGMRQWPLKNLGRIDLKNRFGHLPKVKLINMHCYTIRIKYKIDNQKLSEPLFDHVGELEMRKWEGMCNDAWEVYWADVEDDYAAGGFGPLMYDIAMEIAGSSGLMCDRNSVSNSAARVWNYYTSRADVYTEDIDIKNCPSDMLSQADMIAIRKGAEQPWHQKVYFSTNTVAGNTQPTINRLDKLGKIERSYSKFPKG